MILFFELFEVYLKTINHLNLELLNICHIIKRKVYINHALNLKLDTYAS